MIMAKAVLTVLFFTLFGVTRAAVPADEIKSLPGWDGELPSKHYSGYLEFESKHYHYWFVESENDPANDPVVLWLNGGPGCSSLDGFIYEHGPFRLNETDNTKLYRFDKSWNKLANMIYLESPAGVGFSYSDDPADYNTNDDQTALDNLHSVEKFFELYPEYKTHDFFITGESYGGVYVPTLAEAIVFAKGNGTYTGAPLKGIGVGNGCTGSQLGVCGGERDKYMTPFLLGQGFTPQSLKDSIKKACDFDAPLSSECDSLIAQMKKTIGHVNLYGVYAECLPESPEQVYGAQASKIPFDRDSVQVGGPDACINSKEASTYFNQPSVMEAMHVKKPPFTWAVCANQIKYTSTRPNLPRDTYPLLIKNMRVVIYNGDWDACVPYTDNEAWTEGMGYAVADAWHPWLYNGNQVAGYATRYDTNDFTFITIKGGRHEVPETAPEQAFEMFSRLINGKNF